MECWHQDYSYSTAIRLESHQQKLSGARINPGKSQEESGFPNLSLGFTTHSHGSTVVFYLTIPGNANTLQNAIEK